MPLRVRALHFRPVLYRIPLNDSQRLQKICESHSLSPSGEECEAMKGLLEEARHQIKETLGEPVKDAVIIASTNRFDHYEIADYAVAKAFAKALGLDADASLSDECIDGAGNMDSEFSKIAPGGWLGAGSEPASTKPPFAGRLFARFKGREIILPAILTVLPTDSKHNRPNFGHFASDCVQISQIESQLGSRRGSGALTTEENMDIP